MHVGSFLCFASQSACAPVQITVCRPCAFRIRVMVRLLTVSMQHFVALSCCLEMPGTRPCDGNGNGLDANHGVERDN